MTGFVDTHFHSIQMAERGLDPDLEVASAVEAGMAYAIEIGTHPDELERRLELIDRAAPVYRTSGLAPSYTHSYSEDDLVTVGEHAASGAIVAIGEIGLDFYRNYGNVESQLQLFMSQLEIAGSAELPVVIHNRDADEQTLLALRSASLRRAGVMHCYSSDKKAASMFLDLGMCISFAGNVTFRNATVIADVAKYVPEEAILIETDAPYLSPEPRRGKPNRPSSVVHTYEFVAALRSIGIQELVDQVRINANRMFRLTDRG